MLYKGKFHIYTTSYNIELHERRYDEDIYIYGSAETKVIWTNFFPYKVKFWIEFYTDFSALTYI